MILLDPRMPGMSGEEALRELKPFLFQTKFIAMIGWEDGRTRERIINEIGVEACFDKPVNLGQVVSKVVSLIMVREK